MGRRLIWVTLIALVGPCEASGADSLPHARKEIRAMRANPHGVRLDGCLDDEAWQSAHFVSDFLQKEPEEGAVPAEATEVAVLYDDHALYIGARCYSRNPGELRMHLDRRDRQGPAEQFIVSIDSYLDRRTAYGFGVNTAGVRFDRYNPEDNEFVRDFTYDPVWQAKTAVDSVSWTVEMRIPLSQLRFSKEMEHTFGINFNRWIPERNEDVYWVYVPRQETGWSSRFGNLVGLSNLGSSRRIELLPYVASNTSAETGKNPISDPLEKELRVGGDLKMGLGSNVTLDATVNPDFGQVEADPAVVNLSAFETFFAERRPFFLEGSQLLAGVGPDYYYSRRIGAQSRILGAGKVTGRLPSGTSLGLLTAVTERDRDSEEPLAAYAVGRVQQQFGPSQSIAGISLTGVRRDLTPSAQMQRSFNRQALTGGADWNLRFARGAYQLRGYAGFSDITGSSEAILAAQTSSARYFQRPDVEYVRLDSTRTRLSGYTAALTLDKRSGRHWLWELSGAMESPGFELNDAGRLSQADDIDAFAGITYRETEPGTVFRNYQLSLSGYANWNYGLTRQSSEIEISADATLRNFYHGWLWWSLQPSGQDDTRTRGGPTMRREIGYAFGGGLNNGFARATQWEASVTVGINNLDGWLYRLGGRFSARLGKHTQFTLGPTYQREDQPRQYVSSIDSADGGTGTYGVRYVFARISQSTFALEARLNYFFTPDLSLEVYAQPFAATGRYYRHGELAAAGGNALRVYEETPGVSVVENADGSLTVDDAGNLFTIPNEDFNFVSFRSNVVLRWEFRPGSTLYLVWQRRLEQDRPIDTAVDAASLWESLKANGVNFFAFKVAYWIPL